MMMLNFFAELRAISPKSSSANRVWFINIWWIRYKRKWNSKSSFFLKRRRILRQGMIVVKVLLVPLGIIIWIWKWKLFIILKSTQHFSTRLIVTVRKKILYSVTPYLPSRVMEKVGFSCYWKTTLDGLVSSRHILDKGPLWVVHVSMLRSPDRARPTKKSAWL